MNSAAAWGALESADGPASITRQPIFHRSGEVFGYTLRAARGDRRPLEARDSDQTSIEVISLALSRFGLDELTGGRQAFIGITPSLLRQGVVNALPPNRVVLDVYDAERFDERALNACRLLRSEGYRIAVRDPLRQSPERLLAPLADFIKVDLASGSRLLTADESELMHDNGCLIVAENVDTESDDGRARDLGVDLMQGLYLAGPESLTTPALAVQRQIAKCLREALDAPVFGAERFSEIVAGDASLSKRLLTFARLWAGQLEGQADSIEDATRLLGEQRLRAWAATEISVLSDSAQPSDELKLSPTQPAAE